MNDERFNVWQFFVDGSYEKVVEWGTDAEAVRVFKSYTQTVGARLGTTVRVIITDGGDLIVAEWIQGKGVVFPPQEEKQG